METGRIAVQPFAFESSFILGYKGPFHRARSSIDGVKNSIKGAKINQTIGDRWSRSDLSRSECFELPLLLSGLLINCVQIAVSAADVDHTAGDCGRADDGSVSFERPLRSV